MPEKHFKLTMSDKSNFATNTRLIQTGSTQKLVLGVIRTSLALGYRIAPHLAEAWLSKQFLHAKRYPWPKIEQEWMDKAEKFTLTTHGLPDPAWNGQAMQAYRWGKPRLGRIAVMHGWSGRATQFHRFIPRFIDEGYEVIGIDAPGHGASGGKMASVLHFYNALDSLVQHAGSVDAIVGHSLGGGTTLYAMSQGVKTRRAVLIAPNADLISHSRTMTRQLMLNEDQRLSLQSRIEKQFGVTWEAVSGTHVAPLVKQSGLVIHCKDDREIPFQMGQSIAGAWPGAQLEAVSGLGHRRILSSEDVVTSSLAFIRQ
ncbi:alpha/beta hydrolase [Undibacterium sp. Di27W]|uniref:alpha/beta hydrolase n=1 Tax=Undibacterium sp. Di27W TaxID=3413036 RepID=UPI003BF382F4